MSGTVVLVLLQQNSISAHCRCTRTPNTTTVFGSVCRVGRLFDPCWHYYHVFYAADYLFGGLYYTTAAVLVMIPSTDVYVFDVRWTINFAHADFFSVNTCLVPPWYSLYYYRRTYHRIIHRITYSKQYRIFVWYPALDYIFHFIHELPHTHSSRVILWVSVSVPFVFFSRLFRPIRISAQPTIPNYNKS